MAQKSETPPRWSLSWTTIAATIWALGVVGLAGVLLWKWIAFARVLRRCGAPANAALESLTVQLAARLGLRRAVRLRTVSEPVGPAVFGLWRPVMVIPEAIVREKNLRQIEPILAHELVHVRRGDAWVGVLKLAAQVLWWFHPLVWWANREMCRRREQCCDEEVVAGLGCPPAVYARCLVDVLDWERRRGRRRLLSAAPGVGAAEITTTRLEHIMDDAKRFHGRTPRWTWGVLALAALFFLPGRAMVLGQNAGEISTKGTKDTKEIKVDADRVPTLAEIAKANDAAWNAIRSVDVKYTITRRNIHKRGEPPRETRSTGRWSKAGNRERLRQHSACLLATDDNHLPSEDVIYEFDDYYFDGAVVRHLCDNAPEKEKKDLSCSHQQGLAADMGTRAKHWPRNHEAEPLRYLWNELTLADIIGSWKVSLQGKKTSGTGDTLWLLHAEYPPKDAKDRYAGSYLDIEVNANRRFLVQKTTLFQNNAGTMSDGTRVGIFSISEVQEFQDCGDGVFFPKKMELRLLGDTLTPASEVGLSSSFTATKLSVNSPLPDDAFDFRFPENTVVRQDSPDGKSCTIYLWGPDNKPARKFDSDKECYKYVDKDEFERLGRRVQENLASKKPADLLERGIYSIQTKKYDEAVAAFSEVIAADPKSEEATGAFCTRGMIYLLYQPNYDKAAADFTEAIRRMEKTAEDGEECVSNLRLFRALACANQDDKLDKALADLVKIKVLPLQDDPTCYWITLLRGVIRTRLLYSTNPGEAEAKNQVMLIMQDLQAALKARPSADPYAVMAYLCEKGGNPEGAAKLRQQVKLLQAAQQDAVEPPPYEGVEADFDAAFHQCLMRLLPEIEKTP